MTTPRSLVLLLSSGHTVRIALRDDDLSTGRTDAYGAQELAAFLSEIPACVIIPTDYVVDGSEPDGPGHVVMAYIEDPRLPAIKPNGYGLEAPSDFQRISVEGPGTVVQYG